ncbi:MAG TPA: tRNA preQ1(34) S-adenosylmethionine ribosyltransferase-isomerase QueA [Vicinamibacterales bacterium]|nr:tRNA preQ1(34) S-adenosylmethionine ribosyltransferase-isomerase QueA [Vicinamibacterales bacterium]
MRVADFDFDLPAEQIAQVPQPRGTSRLLVVRRDRGTWEETTIRELPAHLRAGDVVVANDTRVFPARLLGRRDPSGGQVECLLLERENGAEWSALVHPGQKLKAGARMIFDDPVRAPGIRIVGEVLARKFYGRRTVRLTVAETGGRPSLDIDAAIDAIGHMPLPPYIARPDEAADRDRYQTVFARDRGSVAAPTAGLHFDAPLIDEIRARGAAWTTVTLHVGYGTFKPVRSETVEDHAVDPERFSISSPTAEAIHRAHETGSRVIAIGTTTTRALESAASDSGVVRAGAGFANLFVYPGYQFKAIDGLLTNFHLPRSSLLMLVCAFAGTELTLAAYRHAVGAGFRFYSYGDAMIIL